jgi:hypothetical protein
VRRASFRPAIVVVAAASLLFTACHSSSRATPGRSGPSSAPTSGTAPAPTTATTTAAIGPAIVFTTQGRQLDAYATTRPFATHTVVPSPAADRNGVDVSGQICFDPTDHRRFVTVDRTAAADGQVGWGVFKLSGSTLDKLSAQETARLVPTFQRSSDPPAPSGCAFLPDGRLLTTDLGDQSSGAPDGQLIEWFPPFEQDTVVSCKVAIDLPAPQGVLADGDRVLVADSRGGGVASFVASTLPTSNRATGGCGRHDTTGAALALGVVQGAWLQDAAAHGLSRPSAIATAGADTLYVSSPSTGVIAEVDSVGRFVRSVLAPPAGHTLGTRPFPTGTPSGLGVDPAGALYYADTGFVVENTRMVPGLRTGTIRRITFTNGVPRPPEVVDTGLEAPGGIGIWVPSS